MTSTVQDVAIEEQNLWLPVRRIHNDLFEMLHQMLRISPAVRALVVEWIGYALEVFNNESFYLCFLGNFPDTTAREITPSFISLTFNELKSIL